MTGQNTLPHLDSNQKPFGWWLGSKVDMFTSFVCTKPTKSVGSKKINCVGVSRGVTA
jgi:hypothetical protein